MNIIVTGSIAFDYLMSFPGKFTEHFLAEHMERVSLSFLVDSMDKRRGGCAPNIAYTLALLGERPYLMGTAGQDFEDYRQWLEAIDTQQKVSLPQYRKLAHLLEPFLYEERTGWFSLDKDNMRRWLRRLCQS